MKSKWQPTKEQKKEFAIKMQDPEYRDAYLRRKDERAAKKRAQSKFDYPSAGGYYKPNDLQYRYACKMLDLEITAEQRIAAQEVYFGHLNQQPISHDSIHIVDEYMRNC